ncbi:pentapeptide repeat-containing protein [Streptomyces coeruleorubidus]|uniref:pentapeptide repeat-containing protein n=1 Tax=Streptomyces coeruleorubidus TaxID=116188 RepID=UPI0036899CA9
MQGAWLGDTRMDDTDLEGTNLNGADLKGAQMQDARNLEIGQVLAARPTQDTGLPGIFRRHGKWSRMEELMRLVEEGGLLARPGAAITPPYGRRSTATAVGLGFTNSNLRCPCPCWTARCGGRRRGRR